MRCTATRVWVPPTGIVSLLLLLATAGGCGDSGSYELSWTIGCGGGGGPGCAIQSVRQCSEVGIDAVSVLATADSEQETTVFPCFSSEMGASGRGPGLPEGPASLAVSGINPGGEVISGPTTVTVQIPGDGYAPVLADLPRPPACSDSMDNDRDGLVDLADPSCNGPDDDDEDAVDSGN
jgi:hypothetical protein